MLAVKFKKIWGPKCKKTYTKQTVLNCKSTMNAKLQTGAKTRYYNAVAVELHSEPNRNYNRHLTKP